MNDATDYFELERCAQDDKTLPKPFGKAPVKKKIDPEEAAAFKRMRDFGGFLPERSPILDRLCSLIGPLK